MNEIRQLIEKGWVNYPAHIRSAVSERATFESALVSKSVRAGGTVADIGGGWGALCFALSARGYKTILVDDYSDAELDPKDPRWALHRQVGIEVRRRDVSRELIFERHSLDAITCIAVLEHMHHSPKAWLLQAVEALRPGGIVMIGGPNCVHILKRVRAVLGLTSWSPFSEWWDKPEFRSHVREPSARDYLQMLHDLGLRDAEIFGRNFEGRYSPSRLKRVGSVVFDYPMRVRPGLCSDLYAIGRKVE